MSGYIPGMNFRYGKSFQRAADDSVMEFSQRMSQEKVRKEKDRGHRSQSAPKMPPVRSRDEVKNTLNNYHSRKYSGMYMQLNSVSETFPPPHLDSSSNCLKFLFRTTIMVAKESVTLTSGSETLQPRRLKLSFRT